MSNARQIEELFYSKLPSTRAMGGAGESSDDTRLVRAARSRANGRTRRGY